MKSIVICALSLVLLQTVQAAFAHKHHSLVQSYLLRQDIPDNSTTNNSGNSNETQPPSPPPQPDYFVTLFNNAFYFGQGLAAGFVNTDLSTLNKCEVSSQDLLDRAARIYANIWQLTDPNASMQSFRELLHIFQKLPLEFKTCDGIKTILEKLTKRVVLLFDMVDFGARAATNMIYHSFEIVA